MSIRRKTSKRGVEPGARAKARAFDKYWYYRNSVQSPETDVDFFRDTYKSIRGEIPTTLREDFCGTFSLCCEWVKKGPRYRAYGIDLDHEPIQYGLSHYLPQLSKAQRERVQILQENVLNPGLPRADIICAMNFSHFIFKDRSMMKSYYHNCFSTLNKGGILIADAFGGSLCQGPNEEKTKHRGFTYFWDQASFDPVSNYAEFHIHFKPDGQKKIEKVFSYDWRMWSLPEIREMMLEVGFQKSTVYWEGNTRSGEGNGIFKPAEKGDECDAWIAYVIGEK